MGQRRAGTESLIRGIAITLILGLVFCIAVLAQTQTTDPTTWSKLPDGGTFRICIRRQADIDWNYDGTIKCGAR